MKSQLQELVDAAKAYREMPSYDGTKSTSIGRVRIKHRLTRAIKAAEAILKGPRNEDPATSVQHSSGTSD
jgi:hypothetical protein